MQNAIKKAKSGNLKSNNRPGRPLKISNRDGSMIEREITKNPFTPSSEIAKKFLKEYKKQISSLTIRRYLDKKNLKCYVSKKKPLLSKETAKKRLDWCKKYSEKSIEFWKTVIFSDETIISINSNSLLYTCRRFPWTNPYDPKYVRPKIKFPLSVMVWGCFGDKHKPNLCFVDGYMNSNKYIEILKENILPLSRKDQNMTFKDDSAPCHRAKIVKKFVDENKINVMDWPGNSPDLNPIENLWAILKGKIRRNIIPNRRILQEEIVKVWNNEIKDEILSKLIYSMHKRIKQCIKNKGYVTKY